MKWESGGGGMVTTMADFAKFSQMILNGGKFDDKQYISPKSYELMTSDHVGPGSGVARDYFYFPGDGFGFGLGFGVRTDPGNANHRRLARSENLNGMAPAVAISWSTANRTCSSCFCSKRRRSGSASRRP